MKPFCIILFCCISACNSNPELKRKEVAGVVNSCFVYPSVVDSLQFRDLYDSARWYIYALHCDLPYKPKFHTSGKTSFGELELRFENAVSYNDTLDIAFRFMDNGEPVLMGSVQGLKLLDPGVRFNITDRKKIAMFSQNASSSRSSGRKSRFEHPLQPEVLDYIRNDSNKLSDCFRELARRKGLLP